MTTGANGLTLTDNGICLTMSADWSYEQQSWYEILSISILLACPVLGVTIIGGSTILKSIISGLISRIMGQWTFQAME